MFCAKLTHRGAGSRPAGYATPPLFGCKPLNIDFVKPNTQ
jgi:hypothetical protein